MRTAAGITLFDLAMRNELHDVVVRLLQRDNSLEIGDPADLLEAAARWDADIVVEHAIAQGRELDPGLLGLAVLHDSPGVARILIDRRVGLDAQGMQGVTLLHSAAKRGTTEIVAMLLDAGLAPYARTKNDETPLHFAAERGAAEVVAMLLDAGAAADVRDNTDVTPLHLAARAQSTETVSILLAAGVDVNARTGAAWTPLHFALKYGDQGDDNRIAALLLEAGADVGAATAVAGWTPLHIAAVRWSPGVVSNLIEQGATVNARTRFGGWTPLHLIRHRKGEVEAQLRAAGAVDDRFPATDYPAVRSLAQELEVVEERGQRWRGQVNADDLYYRFFVSPYLPQKGGGGFAVEGAFTGPDRRERLVVEYFGGTSVGHNFNVAHLFGLIDETGRHRVLWWSTVDYAFQMLCRDPSTGMDHAIFVQSYDGGTCCPGDIVYTYYDAERETFVPGLVERHRLGFVNDRLPVRKLREREYATRWTSPVEGLRMEVFDEIREGMSSWPTADGVCRWREKSAALATFDDAVDTLRVGRRWKSLDETMPTRLLDASTVEAGLAQLRRLPPDVAKVRTIDSADWSVVTVDGHKDGNVKLPDGVVLVYDKRRRVWQSMLDCDDLAVDEIAGNTLSGKIYYDCHSSRFSAWHPVAVDLLALGAD